MMFIDDLHVLKCIEGHTVTNVHSFMHVEWFNCSLEDTQVFVQITCNPGH